MACKRCEQLGQETNTEPKSHCQCAYNKSMSEYVDQEALDTERAIKTLQREPSPKVKAFYDSLKIKEVKR